MSSRFDKDYWLFREVDEETVLETRQYFILCYNSCCTELAERDLAALLSPLPSGKRAPHTLEAELALLERNRRQNGISPSTLSRTRMRRTSRSVATLVQAQSREDGAGHGQIVAAWSPGTQACTIPRDHLLACMALAEAGLAEEAATGWTSSCAIPDPRTLYDVLGREFGVGYPYLVTPARYLGNGSEQRWTRPDDAVLGYDGAALYIQAVEALRASMKRRASVSGKRFNDSAFVAPYWKTLSSKAADVLLFMRDSAGLIPHDSGPWSASLSSDPGIPASLQAAGALLVAARYARLMRDGTKAFLYRKAADETIETIAGLIASTMSRTQAAMLTRQERLLFHPLLIDCIVLGLIDPRTVEARFALEVLEISFAIEDAPGMYNAQPNGDSFARMARPFIALRLARAYALSGDLVRAQALFDSVTAIAKAGSFQLPELVDPVTRNWYGGLPSISTSAEYVLAAEEIARIALKGRK
ncbi:MAG: hypothetical protein IPP94_15435 [Ignavibacteria bacterium]|nr:hypothetical protein [Ignavibacteria bacterium]